MREIVVDTETTGLLISEGHRIIEITCIELNGTKTGRMWHSYFNPQREVSAGATAVHGLTLDDLKMSPLFKDKADELLQFLGNAWHLIAHNAPFDRGFIEDELRRCKKRIDLQFTDTLAMARSKLPGKKHSLDALCKHYGLYQKNRGLHGATLDAKLLAEVYIRLMGRLDQLDLLENYIEEEKIVPHPGQRPKPLPSRLTRKERKDHAQFMIMLGGE